MFAPSVLQTCPEQAFLVAVYECHDIGSVCIAAAVVSPPSSPPATLSLFLLPCTPYAAEGYFIPFMITTGGSIT